MALFKKKQDNSQQPSIAERQAAIDATSKEHLAKIAAMQESTIEVDNEWLLVAEFVQAYGDWAYHRFINDEISTDEMLVWVIASRKLEARRNYTQSAIGYAGNAGVQGKKGSKVLQRLMNKLDSEMKADEE